MRELRPYKVEEGLGRCGRSSGICKLRQGEGGREERPARWRMERHRQDEECKEQWRRQSKHGRRSSSADSPAQVRVSVRVRKRMGGGLGQNERVREWV